MAMSGVYCLSITNSASFYFSAIFESDIILGKPSLPYLNKKGSMMEPPYLCILTEFEPRHEKTNVLVSDKVRHKPGCTATEDG